MRRRTRCSNVLEAPPRRVPTLRPSRRSEPGALGARPASDPGRPSPMPEEVNFDRYTPLFRNPDLMTVVGRYWPVVLEPGEPRLFATEAGVQVSGRCHWHHPEGPVMLLVHGLEGSVASNYVRSMSALALQAGFDVVRLNVRNCG